MLISELTGVLRKKFAVSESDIVDFKNEIQDSFEIVYPASSIHILKDEPDNRVLEAALEGNCDYIITGDKALLALKQYKNIRILTPSEFHPPTP